MQTWQGRNFDSVKLSTHIHMVIVTPEWLSSRQSEGILSCNLQLGKSSTMSNPSHILPKNLPHWSLSRKDGPVVEDHCEMACQRTRANGGSSTSQTWHLSVTSMY